MSKLKFRQFILDESAYHTPSELQRKQWQQFAAIGYSMAIRGYLNCWRMILIRAHIIDAKFIWAIDEMIRVSEQTEKRARWNMKHLRSL